MDKAITYVKEGGQEISGFNINDIMEVQDGNKVMEFGRQQQSEVNKKLFEISGERDKIE